MGTATKKKRQPPSFLGIEYGDSRDDIADKADELLGEVVGYFIEMGDSIGEAELSISPFRVELSRLLAEAMR